MAIDIEKMRTDLALDQKAFQPELGYRSKELCWEFWRVTVLLIAALGAAAAGGSAVTVLILNWTGKL